MMESKTDYTLLRKVVDQINSRRQLETIDKDVDCLITTTTPCWSLKVFCTLILFSTKIP